MLNRHLYHFREGRTDLGAETFNPIFTDLDARLHKLETLKISWLEAVTELQTFGLERINGALKPTLDQITALLVEATAEHETLLLSTTAAHEAIVQDNADLIESATTFQAELEAWKVAYIKEIEEGGGAPVGTVSAFIGGFFADGSNGGFTNVLGNDVASANAYLNEKGCYVCDGSELNLPGSLVFDGPGRYLPNLTDNRFIQGSLAVGVQGGLNSTSHTHTTGNHTSTKTEMPVHNHYFREQVTWTGGASTPVLSQFSSNSSGGWQFLDGGVIQNTGGGGSHNHGDTGGASVTENRPEFLPCLYYIKAK